MTLSPAIIVEFGWPPGGVTSHRVAPHLAAICKRIEADAVKEEDLFSKVDDLMNYDLIEWLRVHILLILE